jgi:hypothetical protein
MTSETMVTCLAKGKIRGEGTIVTSQNGHIHNRGKGEKKKFKSESLADHYNMLAPN